jgi:uncharacterized membrane protein
MTLVIEGLSRRAGATTIGDAICQSGNGTACVTDRQVRDVKGLNNDLVVRSAYAEVSTPHAMMTAVGQTLPCVIAR